MFVTQVVSSLSPALAPGVVEHKLVVRGAEALVEVADGLVGGGGEGLVDVQEEGVALLELEIFPDELDDPADLLLPVHLQQHQSKCVQIVSTNAATYKHILHQKIYKVSHTQKPLALTHMIFVFAFSVCLTL